MLGLLNSPLLAQGLNYFMNQNQQVQDVHLARQAAVEDTTKRLEDFLEGRDTRRRKEEASAADAELKLKVNQNTLERLMYSDVAFKEAQARQAQTNARLLDKYGERQQQAALDNTQAQLAGQQYKNTLDRKFGPSLLGAQIAQAEAGTAAQNQAARASQQRAALQQAEQQRAAEVQQQQAFNYKNQVVHSLLSGIDTNDPTQVDQAIASAARTPGVTITPQDAALIKQNPQGFMDFAQRVSGAGAIPGEAKMRLESTLKREEQSLKAQDAQRLAVLNARLEPEKEFNLSTAAFKGPEWQTTVDALGRNMLGINYMDVIGDPESEQYNPALAAVVSSSARQIMDRASTGVHSLKEFRMRRDAMLQTYANAYQAGLGLTQDPEKAIAYMPSSVKEYQVMSTQLNDMMQDENSPAARFMRIIAQRGPDGLRDHKASLKEQGLAYGLDPKVIDYLLYAASEKLAAQQRQPQGVM